MVFGRKWAWFAKLLAGAQARLTLRTPLHEILDLPLQRLAIDLVRTTINQSNTLDRTLMTPLCDVNIWQPISLHFSIADSHRKRLLHRISANNKVTLLHVTWSVYYDLLWWFNLSELLQFHWPQLICGIECCLPWLAHTLLYIALVNIDYVYHL